MQHNRVRIGQPITNQTLGSLLQAAELFAEPRPEIPFNLPFGVPDLQFGWLLRDARVARKPMKLAASLSGSSSP